MWLGIDYDNNMVWIRGIILAVAVIITGMVVHELGHIVMTLWFGGTISQFWIEGFTITIGCVSSPNMAPIKYALIGFVGGFAQMIFFAICSKKSKFVLPLIPVTFAYALCEGFMLQGGWLLPAYLGYSLPPDVAIVHLLMSNLMAVGYTLVLLYVSYDLYLYLVAVGKLKTFR